MSNKKKTESEVKGNKNSQTDGSSSEERLSTPLAANRPFPTTINANVQMGPSVSKETDDIALWMVIRNTTIDFRKYKKFVDQIMCGGERSDSFNEVNGKRFLPFSNTDTYRLLKVATEVYLMGNCGVALENFDFASPGFPEEEIKRAGDRLNNELSADELNAMWDRYLQRVNNGASFETLPYFELIRQKLGDLPIKLAPQDQQPSDNDVQNCFGLLQDKLSRPCFLELIWCYWQEEGMLDQTLKAISLRFQNKNGPGGKMGERLNISPLRPMNNLLWGYIQDEQHRLSVVRRAYEYDQHYGLILEGKAIKNFNPADSRSKFLGAFHNLLYLCSKFFKEENDVNKIADGFPILNALKEVHLILTEGMHNQFGDLPSTARIEMLMQQWLLARPEMREVLPMRSMIAYPEEWMGSVDSMKKIQGWTDTSVTHFRDLAVFGEQILLSIRFGAWSTVIDQGQASNWGRLWRAEIQGYLHAYRAVTGADLTSDRETVNVTMPSILLKEQLALQGSTT